MKPWVVALTGASGAAYGLRLIQCLTESGHTVEVIVSESARLVLREETELAPQAFTRPDHFAALLSADALKRVTVYSPKDFTAPVASGSYPVQGMVVVPCSMGTLGAIAGGISQNLIHRAADCMMKENRRLVLVPRETPLNAIHLENMLKLSRIGVRIVPAMPGFYSGLKEIDEMVDFMVGKILDQLEISHALYPRWTGSLKPARANLT